MIAACFPIAIRMIAATCGGIILRGMFHVAYRTTDILYGLWFGFVSREFWSHEMPSKTRTKTNDTVKAAVALAEVTLKTCEDMQDWRSQLTWQYMRGQPNKSDKLVGGVWEIRTNGFERITITILTTHSSFYNDDESSEFDGEPELFVLVPERGECHCSFRRGEKNDLTYLKERYTCWQLNQLFGHDGKFEDLPKHIEALLS